MHRRGKKREQLTLTRMTTYAMMHATVPARRRRRERERDQFASARKIVQKDSQNILVQSAKREKRKRDKNADNSVFVMQQFTR
jgi:hypothetical protein